MSVKHFLFQLPLKNNYMLCKVSFYFTFSLNDIIPFLASTIVKLFCSPSNLPGREAQHESLLLYRFSEVENRRRKNATQQQQHYNNRQDSPSAIMWIFPARNNNHERLFVVFSFGTRKQRNQFGRVVKIETLVVLFSLNLMTT